MRKMTFRVRDWWLSGWVFFRRAGNLKWFLMVTWFGLPWLLQTLIHPSDLVALWSYLVTPQPASAFGPFTSAQLWTAEKWTVAALGLLLAVQFVCLICLYRQTLVTVRLCPLAGLLVGGVGNVAFWLWTGAWDSEGMAAGFFPFLVMLAGEKLCERVCADLVFGPGVHPEASEFFDVADALA